MLKQVLVSSEAAMNSAVWHWIVCIIQGSHTALNKTLHIVTQCTLSPSVHDNTCTWSKTAHTGYHLLYLVLFYKWFFSAHNLSLRMVSVCKGSEQANNLHIPSYHGFSNGIGYECTICTVLYIFFIIMLLWMGAGVNKNILKKFLQFL